MTELLKRFRKNDWTCRCCGMPGGPSRNRREHYRAAKKRERIAVREEIEAELEDHGPKPTTRRGTT